MSPEIAIANEILRVRTGSHLYGTSTPESDEDFSAVFSPPVAYVFGMQRVEQVDASIVSKDATGKNDGDAVDFTLYELRKFAKLVLENNPNMLEILFAPDEHVVLSTPLGERLRAAAHLFPYRGLKSRFIGYAQSQMHKMQIRTENFDALDRAIESFERILEHPKHFVLHDLKYQKKELAAEGYPLDGIVFGDDYTRVGDLQFQYHWKVSDALKRARARRLNATSRVGLMKRYGYDTKFGAHLIRLLYEGRDLLDQGYLTFPLPQADLLMQIRSGEWPMEKVLEHAEHLKTQIEESHEKSFLRPKPAFHEVDAIVQSIVRDHLAV